MWTRLVKRRRLTAWRGVLFLAAAVLSAVISDLVIETGAYAGLFGAAFADHDHRSVLATLTAGCLLVIAAAFISLLERFRVLRSDGDPDGWLAEAAHDISMRSSWRVFPSTLAVALGTRYAMESAELLRTSGHLATGVTWLGGPLLIALLLHAAFCAVTIVALLAVMRAIDPVLNGLVDMVVTLVALILCARPVAAHFAHLRQVRHIVHRRSPLATRLGERAPPPLHVFVV